jgi:curved DNA-binding protein CbpA
LEREDHYAVLGVPPGASAQEIKRAFRRLAVQFHPDQRPSRIADMLMRRLTEAYEVLRDPERRAAYDAELRAQKEAQPKIEPKSEPPPSSDHRRVGRTLDDHRQARVREAERMGERAVGDHAAVISELAAAHEAELAAVSKRTELAHRTQGWVWASVLAAIGALVFLLAKLLLL